MAQESVIFFQILQPTSETHSKNTFIWIEKFFWKKIYFYITKQLFQIFQINFKQHFSVNFDFDSLLS